MSVCCVDACTNNYHNNRNVHYYRFPTYRSSDTEQHKVMSLKQRMAWIAALKNKSSVTIKNIHNKKICSAHFVSGKRVDCNLTNSRSWAPTIGLTSKYDNDISYKQTIKTEPIDSVDFSLSEHFNNFTNGHTIKNEYTTESITSPIAKVELDPLRLSTETREIKKMVEAMNGYTKNCNLMQPAVPKNVNREAQIYIDDLHSVIRRQAKTIENLTKKLQKNKFDLDTFRDDDAKTSHYTGIPDFGTLEKLYKQIEPYIQKTGENNLTKSQMFILTLMKRKLGLFFTDVAYRYEISPLTARITYHHIIDVLREKSSTKDIALKC